jgi:ATP-dependent Zn protease
MHLQIYIASTIILLSSLLSDALTLNRSKEVHTPKGNALHYISNNNNNGVSTGNVAPKKLPSEKNKPSSTKSSNEESQNVVPPDSLENSLQNFGLKRYLIFTTSLISSACLEIYSLLSKKLNVFVKYTSASLYSLSVLFVLLDYVYFRAIMSAYAVTIYFMLPVSIITFAISTFFTWFPFVSEHWTYIVTVPLILAMLFWTGESESMGTKITFQEFLKADYFMDQAVQKLVVYRHSFIVTVYLKSLYKLEKDETTKKTFPKAQNNVMLAIDDKNEHSEEASNAQAMPSFYFTIGSLEHFERVLKETQELIYNQTLPMIYIPIEYVNYGKGLDLSSLIYILFLAYYFYSAKDSALGTLSLFFKQFDWSDTTEVVTCFKDVKGMEGAKAEVQELVIFLKNPGLYANHGISFPKGILLSGPPGCGKTMLAKAIAGEADVPFLAVSGAEFVEMFVGLGSKRIRDLFAKARNKAPCIVFIDEIDAIGRDRTSQIGSSEGDHTLSQLLVEMDGFFSDKTNVIVIGATNHPDVLDSALKRPGRFDRHITIPLPTMLDRQKLFKLYLKKIPKAIDFSLANAAAVMAKLTAGKSGAEIKHICNEAGILAVRRAQDLGLLKGASSNANGSVTESDELEELDEGDQEDSSSDKKDAISGKVELIMRDLEDAFERVLLGHKNTSLKSRQEHLLHTAFHEAGHALIAWLDPHGLPPRSISIVPRTSGTLGQNLFGMRDEVLLTKQQILADIKVALGGHLAEALIYPDHVSTGASSDFETATKLAYTYIGLFEDNAIPFNAETLKSLSQQTRAGVDLSVRNLLAELRKAVSDTFKDNRKLLIKLANKLLAVETMSEKAIAECIGPKPEAPPLAPSLDE